MARSSVLLLAALLSGQPGATQEVPSPPDERIVRVWLGSSGPFAPGDPVRVYVRSAEDGYLIVLRSGTDGRIRVLYPSHPRDPQAGAYARAGTYEIRGAGEAVAFVIDEPMGTGRVLAALSPRPYRSDEFVRQTQWNPDALVGTGSDGDLEGAMTDIVQRMLGEGYFTYDVVSYVVAPRRYATRPPSYPPSTSWVPQADTEYVPGVPASCVGCNFVSVIVIDPFLGCNPFYGVCVGFPFVDFGPRPPPSGLCGFGSDCWRQGRTIALTSRGNPALRARSVPHRPPPYAVPQSAPRQAAPARIEPRRRAPVGAAPTPSVATRRATLVPGSRTIASLGRRPAAGRTVTVAMARTPPRARVEAPPAEGIVPVAALKPAQPGTPSPQPVARARVRTPGASLSVSPAPQRSRSMTYRPFPARSGASAATAGARTPAAGTSLRGTTASAAWRGVPPRAIVRRR